MKLNFTGRYDFDLSDYKAHVQGVLVYADDATSDLRVPAAVATGGLPSYATVDFAAGIDFGAFKAEAFIQNAFDERGQISRGVPCGQCYIRPYAYVVKPQTVGLRVGFEY